jgi:cytosine/uracil/thiamine/allantoin permease
LVHLGVLAVSGEPTAASKAIAVPAFLANIYSYAWFASFGVAFVSYLLMMSVRGDRMK